MSDEGFTLIELIVTISILVIVLSLAVLHLDRDIFYMKRMADEFVMDVRYVQTECMKRTTASMQIRLDVYNNCYYIFDNTRLKKTVAFKSRYKIDYSNEIRNITFTYEGAPVNAGTFRILDTRTNQIKEVSIVPATGRTVIKE